MQRLEQKIAKLREEAEPAEPLVQTHHYEIKTIKSAADFLKALGQIDEERNGKIAVAKIALEIISELQQENQELHRKLDEALVPA